MNVIDVTPEGETFSCNVFLFSDPPTTLVDAGTRPGLVEAVSDQVDTLDRVVLTHQHADHVGQVGAVCEAFEPDVYAYADHEYRTHQLRDGDEIQVGAESFEVVYTPGHADDHVSLVSDTTLVSGDVVVYNDSAFSDGSFGKTEYDHQSREVLIESIEELLERMPESVEHMYAGHGDPFHGDVRAVVERALERAKRREPKYGD